MSIITEAVGSVLMGMSLFLIIPWFPVIMSVSMVLAVFLAHYTDERWANQEKLRGLFAGLLVYTVGAF